MNGQDPTETGFVDVRRRSWFSFVNLLSLVSAGSRPIVDMGVIRWELGDTDIMIEPTRDGRGFNLMRIVRPVDMNTNDGYTNVRIYTLERLVIVLAAWLEGREYEAA